MIGGQPISSTPISDDLDIIGLISGYNEIYLFSMNISRSSVFNVKITTNNHLTLNINLDKDILLLL